MIEAMLYYSNDSFESVVEAILRLPEILRPVRFGRDEGRKKPKDLVSNTLQFRRFLNDGPSGAYLHAEQIDYCFYMNGLNEFYVYITGLDHQYGDDIIHALSLYNVKFAYVSDNDERKRRNRLIKSASYGTDEAWVGRDWHRYIPGLYWQTVIPELLAQQHNVPLNKLKRSAFSIEEPTSGVCLLKFFERPDQWLAYADQLDRLCEQTHGVFAISRVRSAFERAETFVETEAALQDWR